MRRRKYTWLVGGSLTALVILLVVAVSCKSKGKHGRDSSDEPSVFIEAPTAAILKTPETLPSFVRTPVFTVQGVEAGDTVELFQQADCAPDSLLGRGVVGDGQNTLDITLAALVAAGNYPLYAQRTNQAAQTSPCSERLASYQLITCPDDSYVPVEANEELGTSGFCVMKTEAKQGANNIPVAQYAGTPWTNITIINAKAACRSIPVTGGSCDLISNAQWMAVARDIEATAANWSSGVVGTGTLNRGHSDSGPMELLTIVYPDNAWDQTGQDAETWTQKRTNVLSNGGVLWDFVGNAFEWADWETGGDTVTTAPNSCPGSWKSPFSFTCAALSPQDYLPGNPAGINPEDYMAHIYGVGKVFGTDDSTRNAGSEVIAVRGGRLDSDSNGGVFYLNLRNKPTDKGAYAGFRCVCLVTGEP